MSEVRETAPRNLSPAQATALAVLVELEARWENMRKGPSPAPQAGSSTLLLQGVQKAYDAFHTKLVAYNKQYAPAHVPELLLNTPLRLALWCRTMRDLYRAVEQDPQIPCPVQLLVKAHRWAHRIGVRIHKDAVCRSVSVGTIREAMEDLEGLVQWCEGLLPPVAATA